MEFSVSRLSSEHIIVRAGAGAGKTYALTHRVMDIAEEYFQTHGKFPRVIVTTFTRKATQELRERLMLLALEEKPHLVDFVNSRSHLVVSTIHGVMDLYLKRYGGNICIDPGYRIVGAAEAGKIARQTLRQILFGKDGSANLLESFPFNKLVSLARRLDRLWAENPKATPFSLADFAEIFSSHASEIAKGLKEAALRIKEESVKPDWLAMADEYQRVANLLSNVDDVGKWRKNRELVLSVLENMKTARKSSKGPPVVSDETAEYAKEFRERAKELSEPVYDPAVWQDFTERFIVFDQISRLFSEKFRKLKLDQGILEISDLESMAMECARQAPASLNAFASEWDYWLVDEYQDTSPFQVELIRLLSGESPSFIVGDPQQSIYLFRGARSEVFSHREDEIVSGGGTRKFLSTNRRSRPELLLFLNDFFGRQTPPFQAMEPFLKPGETEDPKRIVATVFIGQKSDAARTGSGDDGADQDSDETIGKSAAEENSAAGAGGTSAADSADEEMHAIVAHVQGLVANGTRLEDICVLARTNKTLIEVASLLGRYRLPTHIHAASGFYDRREIRDALTFLKFLVNPHDNFNLVELLRSPWFRMPDEALSNVTMDRPKSIWLRLIEKLWPGEDFAVISFLAKLSRSAMEKGLSGAFHQGLIESGFIDLSHHHDVSGRRESNIWKLLSRLRDEESKAGFNPLAFIAGSMVDAGAYKIEEGSSEGDAVAAIEPERINLMTVHASKGLEFKHVILPRMQQKPRLTVSEEFTYDEGLGRWAMRVPHGENGDMIASLPEKAWLKRFKENELAEHARVLYVALTRAAESVFLSWTGNPQPHSWAEMTKLDLSDGVHETAHFSYRVSREIPELADPAIAKHESIQPRRPWREKTDSESASVSVSDLLEQQPGVHFAAGSEKDISRLLRVASQGTAVHRLMELLKYPSRDRLGRLIAKWFPNQEGKVLKAVEFVQKSSAPPLLEIIQNGEVEWGFAIVENGILIEGQIDLWGRTNNGEAWLIDYKTGNPEFRSKAFEQMALYAFALRKSGLIKPEETLQLAAVYPFAGDIFIEPEPPPDKVAKMLRH
jgi:ATP-dependent helicase/nuclease subunit A